MARPTLVSPWALLREELPLWLLLLPALVVSLALGLPASFLVQAPCSKPLKVCYAFDIRALITNHCNTAEALDLWFENLQNYEATLVSCLCQIAIQTEC